MIHQRVFLGDARQQVAHLTPLIPVIEGAAVYYPFVNSGDLMELIAGPRLETIDER